MRKFLVALSVLLLVAVVILKVASAQDPQDVKKASTEAKKECCKSATAKECPMMAAAKTGDAKACDMAKSKEMSADHANCKAKADGCKEMSAEAKAECCKGATADAKAEMKACCKK